jgi:hypothetical protein
MGSFVERIATVMSTSRGTAARRVSNPSTSIAPDAISTTPTNGPHHLGRRNADPGKPARALTAGNRNF